ncbi:MAG TPA: hypothetical protein VFI31_00325 [Pirellulales bacterium]|nr:hypothetical protein [Pirellulales bacterium]
MTPPIGGKMPESGGEGSWLTTSMTNRFQFEATMPKRQSNEAGGKRKPKPKFGIRWNRAISVEHLPKKYDLQQYCNVYATWARAKDDLLAALAFQRDTIRNQLVALEQAKSLDEYEATFHRLQYGEDDQ